MMMLAIQPIKPPTMSQMMKFMEVLLCRREVSATFCLHPRHRAMLVPRPPLPALPSTARSGGRAADFAGAAKHAAAGGEVRRQACKACNQRRSAGLEHDLAEAAAVGQRRVGLRRLL